MVGSASRWDEDRRLDVPLHVVVLGSSLVVYPAAGFPVMAKRNGAMLAIVNREETELDGYADLVLHDEIGQVISSVPMVQAVAVPRQVCKMENVAVQAPKSGTGAVLGAIAGGVVGHALGDGGARAATTMIGMVGGTVLGDRMEQAGDAQVQTIQRCETQHMVENQIKGYRVTYEYAGKQYVVEWPTDPGPSIALQVLPKASRQAVPGTPYLGVQPAPLPVNAPVDTSASSP